MKEFEPLPNADLLVIAGEASGDEHAAAVVRGLKQAHPDAQIAALGGARLFDAEAKMLLDLTAHSAVGIWEVLKSLKVFLRLIDQTVEWVAQNQPKAIMFVDFVGFNLQVAKRLFEAKLSAKGGGKTKLYFYISPQIWAWKKHRRHNMAKWLDGLATIFPFEAAHYADTDLPVEFVGHPFVVGEFDNPISYSANGALLLLPGSRKAIVKKHLPILWDAYKLLKKDFPELKAASYYASESLRKQMIEITGGELPLYPGRSPIKASAVAQTAGTISLMTALAEVPGIVMYRTDRLTYAFGKIVYKLGYLGMPNLLLKRTVMPEYIQKDSTPQKIAAAIKELYEKKEEASAVAKRGADDLKALLGESAKRNVVEWIADGADL